MSPTLFFYVFLKLDFWIWMAILLAWKWGNPRWYIQSENEPNKQPIELENSLLIVCQLTISKIEQIMQRHIIHTPLYNHIMYLGNVCNP